jgi:hypothetical protein
MPQANISSVGKHFYYDDSGPLEGTYTTIFLVHGLAFTASRLQSSFPSARCLYGF